MLLYQTRAASRKDRSVQARRTVCYTCMIASCFSSRGGVVRWIPKQGSVCTNNYCKLPGAVGGLYFSSFQHRLGRSRKCLFEGTMVKQHGHRCVAYSTALLKDLCYCLPLQPSPLCTRNCWEGLAHAGLTWCLSGGSTCTSEPASPTHCDLPLLSAPWPRAWSLQPSSRSALLGRG